MKGNEKIIQIKSEIVYGGKRIFITRSASGVDKTREAVLKVMGPGWEYAENKK